MRVLAELKNRRAQLESEIAELDQRANQLWAGWTGGVSFEYDGDEASETVPPCSFWPSTTEDESELSVADAIKAYLRPQTRRTVVLPWCVADFWPTLAGRQAAVYPAAQGRCSHCGSCHGLTEWDSTLYDWLFVSSWCLTCGWSEGRELFEITAPAPLFCLIHALSEALSRRESVLRLVTAKIAVLLSRLRLAAFARAIVTSQRSFFAHHGAHPPRVRLQRVMGLLPEKAFEPQIA